MIKKCIQSKCDHVLVPIKNDQINDEGLCYQNIDCEFDYDFIDRDDGVPSVR